jgi:hypothetical protein
MKTRNRSAAALVVSALSSTALYAAPLVTGNTVSWPTNGWYQVQRADNYATLCQGGRSCEVPDGTYIVINHTSGTRYEKVVVAGGTGAPTANAVQPPTNLRLIAYSMLSGELFWDRAPASARVSQYEVSRNGAVIGTTNGTSWFEGQIKVGDQRYEVVAIDRESARSEPAHYPDSDTVDDLLQQAVDLVDDIKAAFRPTELNTAVAYGWRMANEARRLSQGIEPVDFQIGRQMSTTRTSS